MGSNKSKSIPKEGRVKYFPEKTYSMKDNGQEKLPSGGVHTAHSLEENGSILPGTGMMRKRAEAFSSSFLKVDCLTL